MAQRGSQEWKANIALSLRGRDVWNKGLTKNDPRVSQYVNKNKSLFKKGQHASIATEFKKNNIPHNLGRPLTKETKRKISLKNSHPRPEILGERNPRWKGKDIGYRQIHRRMHEEFRDIVICQTCGSDDDLELANVSGLYLLDDSDWMKLCIRCHKKYDNIVRNFKKQSLQTTSK